MKFKFTFILIMGFSTFANSKEFKYIYPEYYNENLIVNGVLIDRCTDAIKNINPYFSIINEEITNDYAFINYTEYAINESKKKTYEYLSTTCGYMVAAQVFSGKYLEKRMSCNAVLKEAINYCKSNEFMMFEKALSNTMENLLGFSIAVNNNKKQRTKL